jgi:hypothetical protein
MGSQGFEELYLVGAWANLQSYATIAGFYVYLIEKHFI